MKAFRIAAGALTLSAAGLISIFVHEDYVSQAMIPTKGDRPTIGFGSTFHEDGSAVKLGESTTPVRAVLKAQAHIGKAEKLFKESLGDTKISQTEFDVYMSFVYQFGIHNWNTSSMLRHLVAGNYKAACDSLLLWKKAGGFDCSIPGNKQCAGVWTRQLERHANCIAAQ